MFFHFPAHLNDVSTLPEGKLCKFYLEILRSTPDQTCCSLMSRCRPHTPTLSATLHRHASVQLITENDQNIQAVRIWDKMAGAV